MPGFKKSHEGKRCTVEGYDNVKGTIRFIGDDPEGKMRIGVEMDEPVGNNNGTKKVRPQ